MQAVGPVYPIPPHCPHLVCWAPPAVVVRVVVVVVRVVGVVVIRLDVVVLRVVVVLVLVDVVDVRVVVRLVVVLDPPGRTGGPDGQIPVGSEKVEQSSPILMLE